MKGPPTLVASLSSRNYGIACTWRFLSPGWRRNRNITQMLGAMPETATALTVDDPRISHGRPW